MNGCQILRNPGMFLGVFSLAAILLMPLWIYLSEFYLVGLASAVSLGAQWTGVPSQFQLHSFAADQGINPGIVAGAALFIATPNRSMSWKAGWIAGLAILFGALHVSLFLAETHLAHAHFLDQILAIQRLSPADQASLPPQYGTFCDSRIDLCEYWAYPVLNSMAWFAAVQRQPQDA